MQCQLVFIQVYWPDREREERLMPDNNDSLKALLRQRKVLADFGDVALQSEDLDEVLTGACRLGAGRGGPDPRPHGRELVGVLLHPGG